MKTKQIGQFDGFSGTKRKIFEVDSKNVVSSHSCLLPGFSITMRVAELRKLIASLKPDGHITVTVGYQKAPKFTFVR